MIYFATKLTTFLLYIVALLILVKFKLSILFDLPLVAMVIFGTILLTMSTYRRAQEKASILNAARWNAQITGYLTTFILMFARLSSGEGTDTLMYDVALNCRPLLYALMIQFLLKDMPSLKANSISSPSTAIKPPPDIKTRLLESGLTDRECAIGKMILDDLTNKEIADRLSISESTVKKHSTNLYKKLEVSNRNQFKRWAIRS
jgi:DNA-binding CsgD family transcriptional regulator